MVVVIFVYVDTVERERDRERETDRQTDRDRERQRQRVEFRVPRLKKKTGRKVFVFISSQCAHSQDKSYFHVQRVKKEKENGKRKSEKKIEKKNRRKNTALNLQPSRTTDKQLCYYPH